MVSNETMRQWNRDHSNQTAMSWQRSMVATGWASSGKQWTELFSRFNSGTYNNQWMVLDATKVHIGAPLPSKDVLWIAEQVPGKQLSPRVLVKKMDSAYRLFRQMSSVCGDVRARGDDGCQPYPGNERLLAVLQHCLYSRDIQMVWLSRCDHSTLRPFGWMHIISITGKNHLPLRFGATANRSSSSGYDGAPRAR